MEQNLYRDSKNSSQEPLVQRWSGEKSSVLIGAVVVGIVLLLLRSLVTTGYLNLAFLELARRPPAPERAQNFMDQAQQVDPEAPGITRARGVLALVGGDGATAYPLLKRAFANRSPDAFEHFQMALALDAMDNHRAATDEYRLARAAPFFVNTALQKQKQNDWAGAERNFRRALEIQPQDATIVRGLGKFYRAWGKLDLAHHYLARALEMETRPYERALLDGQLAELDGDEPRAVAAYQTAIRSSATTPEAYWLLGELYLGRQEWAAAAEVLQAGVQNATPTFGLNMRLAQVLIHQEDWNGAAAALGRAATEQKNSDRVYLVRGQLELAQNHPVAALTAFERGQSLAPSNAEIHFWRGRALEQTGQCEAARAAYAQAIALAPDDARFAPEQQEWGAC